MPVSFRHEGLVELVRRQPGAIPRLLGELLHVPVPRFTSASISESTLNEPVPVEHRADAVVLQSGRNRPVLGLIVEAQLRRDNRKRYSWPQYAMNARARHKCPFLVVVIAPSPFVARWAAQPIDVGNGTIFRQHIIGPRNIPKLTDARRAAREPELAVLSAMAHTRKDTPTARQIVLAAIAGVSKLPDHDQRSLYSDLIRGSLSAALRKVVEMQPETRKFFSAEFQRTYDNGRLEGEAKGEAKGKVESLLKILTQRRLRMTARQRRQIDECTDATMLDRWLDRVLSVSSVAELLAASPRPNGRRRAARNTRAVHHNGAAHAR